MKKLLIALVLVAATITGATAQSISGGNASSNTPNWNVYRNTSNQSISGTHAAVVFNAATYDPSSVCNLSTGICTVNAAGLYHIECQVRVDATTGPSVNGNLNEVRIYTNTSTLQALNFTNAQVGSLAGPSIYTRVSTDVRLSVNDTVQCDAASASTGPSVIAANYASYMTGFRTGP